MRRPLIIVGVLLGALVLLGIRLGFAASPPQSRPIVPTPVPSNAWDISGTIQQMTGQSWAVQGFIFEVTPATKVSGDVPSIGTFVHALGTAGPDGTWVATDVSVGSAAVSSPMTQPAATSTPFPASPPVATTAPPTPTAQLTATPAAQPADVSDALGPQSGSPPLVIPPILPAPARPPVRGPAPKPPTHVAPPGHNPGKKPGH
jgi:hypothetical protein